jgi:hypothetical protein
VNEGDDNIGGRLGSWINPLPSCPPGKSSTIHVFEDICVYIERSGICPNRGSSRESNIYKFYLLFSEIFKLTFIFTGVRLLRFRVRSFRD